MKAFLHLPKAITDTYESDQKSHTRRDRVRLAVEILVLLTVVIGTVVAIRTLKSVNQSVREATRSADAAQLQTTLLGDQIHKGQRAYLVFHHAVLDGEPMLGNSLFASIDLTNSGQTPATDVFYFLQLDIAAGVPTQFPRPVAPMSAIGRDRTLVPVVKKLNVLTASDMTAINADYLPFLKGNVMVIPQGPRLYLYGAVRYTDVFGNPGETEFCGVYSRRDKAFMGCGFNNGLK